MPRNEIFAAVDELTLLLQNAKKIPFSDSVMVNQAHMSDMLRRITGNYDPALETADKIIANEEGILRDAATNAQKTMSTAQTQAQGMVNEANTYAQNTRSATDNYVTEKTRGADEQARAILADAQNRAQNMIEDAKAQADELVSQTTILARAEAQARELLDNANQHAAALRQQTQKDLGNLLDHVDTSVSTQLNEIRLMKQNLASIQTFDEDDDAPQPHYPH